MEVIPRALRDEPPAYAAIKSATNVKINLKQAASFADTPNTLQHSPRWARLLGTALSREWLHSSGIKAHLLLPVTPATTFETFDRKIRDRLSDGAHGEPLRWLSWVYVLRGRWLGHGTKEQRMLIDGSTWENAKVAMQSMLDVRIDLVFTFSQLRQSREVRPPAYKRSCRDQKADRCRSTSPAIKSSSDNEQELGDGVVVEGKPTWTRRACQLCPLKGLLEGHRFPLQRDRFHAVPSKIWSAEMALNDKSRSDSRC